MCHKFWGLWLVEVVRSALLWLVDNAQARLAPGWRQVAVQYTLHFSFGQPDSWSGSDDPKHIMFGTVGKLLSRWTQLWMNYSCYFWYEWLLKQKPPRILEMCCTSVEKQNSCRGIVDIKIMLVCLFGLKASICSHHFQTNWVSCYQNAFPTA